MSAGDRGRARRGTAVLVAALLAVMVLALAACGGDDSTSGSGGSGGSGSEGSGPEKTSLKVGILKISDVYPIWVAQKEGFFKDVGIDKVEATEMAGGAAIQPAIQSGQLDLGWSNVVSVVISKPQGFNFKFFAGGTWIGPGAERNQVVLVKKDSPITNAKQLEGKRYGVNTLGNIAEVSVRSWLDHQGVDPSKVKIVELGTPITVPPLVQGRVDAVSANEPAVTIGMQTGKVRIPRREPVRRARQGGVPRRLDRERQVPEEQPEDGEGLHRGDQQGGRLEPDTRTRRRSTSCWRSTRASRLTWSTSRS